MKTPTIQFPSERQLVSLSACGIAGILFMFYMHGMVLDGWWLDSRDGVTAVAWTVPVLSAAVTAILRSYLAPVALWMELFTGMGIILWLNGLGNIWPIVLAVGGAVLCAFVAIGTVPIMLPRFLWKQVKATERTLTHKLVAGSPAFTALSVPMDFNGSITRSSR